MTGVQTCALPIYDFEKYHKRLIKEIEKKFNQEKLLKEPELPFHFCMKFPFDTTKIKEIERIIKKIVKGDKELVELDDKINVWSKNLIVIE